MAYVGLYVLIKSLCKTVDRSNNIKGYNILILRGIGMLQENST